MAYDQEIVKQLQRRFRNWNPNKRCKTHTVDRCCDYHFVRKGQVLKLHLCNLGLEQLPSEVWQFSSLEGLYLSDNQLTLSAELGNLSALRYLDLSGNRLRTLPVEIGKLSVLEWLDLSDNLFNTLPAELGNLSILKTLHLSNNQLSTLPAELENLSALESLYLYSNPLLPKTGLLKIDELLGRESILSYLHALSKQPSHQLADRPSLSKNALVSPQNIRGDFSGNIPIPEMSREKGTASTKETLPLKIFYCYAHEDKDLRDRIDKHLGTLKRLGQVVGWYDREIQAGTEWEREIEENLNTAHIILLLVSADFVASDYCYGVEMTKALELHRAGQAHVLPVLLRSVDWQDAPFATLQMLPTGAKPIMQWKDQDEALEDVAKGIRNVVSSLRAQKR